MAMNSISKKVLVSMLHNFRGELDEVRTLSLKQPDGMVRIIELTAEINRVIIKIKKMIEEEDKYEKFSV